MYLFGTLFIINLIVPTNNYVKETKSINNNNNLLFRKPFEKLT